MKIKSVIIWPRGRKTTRYIDWTNDNERRQFAKFAQSALEHGATVTTRAVAIDPQTELAAIKLNHAIANKLKSIKE